MKWSELVFTLGVIYLVYPVLLLGPRSKARGYVLFSALVASVALPLAGRLLSRRSAAQLFYVWYSVPIALYVIAFTVRTLQYSASLAVLADSIAVLLVILPSVCMIIDIYRRSENSPRRESLSVSSFLGLAAGAVFVTVFAIL